MSTPQPRHDEDGDEEKVGPGNCCKTFTKFLLSQVGLSIIVILYSVAGAFIFKHLEQTNEKQECIKKMEKYVVMANETKQQIWMAAKAYVKQYNDDDEDPDVVQNALIEFRQTLVQFRDDARALQYDGKDCNRMGEDGGPGYKWSLPGALLFSVTVITTIGNHFDLKLKVSELFL